MGSTDVAASTNSSDANSTIKGKMQYMYMKSRIGQYVTIRYFA